MHSTEWPEEYLIRKEAYVDQNHQVVVVSANGSKHYLGSDASIIDACWMGDAVVITYRSGQRLRYYGPYGSQREYI